MFLSEKRKKEIETLLWNAEPNSDNHDLYRFGLANGYREGVIDTMKDVENEKQKEEFVHFDPCK